MSLATSPHLLQRRKLPHQRRRQRGLRARRSLLDRDPARGSVFRLRSERHQRGDAKRRAAVQAIIDGSGAVANVGDGTNTAYTITHNLNSRDVIVQVYDNATYDTVYVDTTRSTVNTVVLTFATAPALNAYRVVIARVS